MFQSSLTGPFLLSCTQPDRTGLDRIAQWKKAFSSYPQGPLQPTR